MELVVIPLQKIHPYESNPRINDGAVSAVAESIRQCGYIAPIIVDEDGVILAGHTRYKALQKLGYVECQVAVVAGLTEEQKNKYRILDNKTNELADWDFDLLADELDNLDLSAFDFDWDVLNKRDEYDYFYDSQLSNSKAKTFYIVINGQKVEMTQDECDRILSELQKYIDMNGVSYGFVRYLLDGD